MQLRPTPAAVIHSTVAAQVSPKLFFIAMCLPYYSSTSSTHNDIEKKYITVDCSFDTDNAILWRMKLDKHLANKYQCSIRSLSCFYTITFWNTWCWIPPLRDLTNTYVIDTWKRPYLITHWSCIAWTHSAWLLPTSSNEAGICKIVKFCVEVQRHRWTDSRCTTRHWRLGLPTQCRLIEVELHRSLEDNNTFSFIPRRFSLTCS